MYLGKCEIVESGDGTAVVRGPCRVTGETYETPPIPIDALVAYADGMLAQDAFPMLSNEAREFLISGTSPDGWRLTFRGRQPKQVGRQDGLAGSPQEPAEVRLSADEVESLRRVVDSHWVEQRRDFWEQNAEHGHTNWDAEWHEHPFNDWDKLKGVIDRVDRKEVIATRGDFALTRTRPPDGTARYALERDGCEVCSDADGDSFYHEVGTICGSWELWLATGADRECEGDGGGVDLGDPSFEDYTGPL